MTQARDSKVRRVVVFLLPRQVRALQALRKHNGTSVSEQVRRGVDLWLGHKTVTPRRKTTSIDAALAALGETK